MTVLQRWLLALALVTVVVVVGYEWLDQPVADWVHGHLASEGRSVLAPLAQIPDPLVPAAAIAFFGAGLCAMAGRPLLRLATVVAACSLSVTMAEATKNLLKWVFGRAWPDSWTSDAPTSHFYGFNWFQGGSGHDSFPSGHMAAACAVLSVLWICYPRLRPLWALGGLGVAGALIAGNYHFFSDVVAGGFVGASTGWMTILLLKRQEGLPRAE